MQDKIPFMAIRGGSSKALFFKAEDLSENEQIRNEQVIKAMEGTLLGDPRQIDGLGGANSLTSKVAIISKSKNEKADLDYLFLQVVVGEGKVSFTQTCGNILAGVLPFALETGMVAYEEPTTSVRVNMVNTSGICEVIAQTPNKALAILGNAQVDGVVGTGAPIVCNYLDTIGSSCGSLLPTNNPFDIIDGIKVTCIDNGMPVVLMMAKDFGLVGNESKEILEANKVLRQKIESMRIQAGFLMNLGDVSKMTVPKMCLISKALNGGIVNTRMFIPHVVHEAIGVLAAVSVATACVVNGSICQQQMQIDGIFNADKMFSIEHPSGEFTVYLNYELNKHSLNLISSGVIRTARILAKGEVYIPPKM
ncbi:4-oxalomesaconate tautomerase [Parasediminibacterium paludis]|uniref:4-oxalomesaconate tautomerase n=1 Tax=Parasediminibacterium paludis TaxID=908966 RepID=A0ABV8PVS3_9BACT